MIDPKVTDTVVATINDSRRLAIAAHHTATHLLHWALQQILGSHIRQAGSLVEPNRLRFDFNHHKPLSFEEILKIEDLVNEKIRENQTVSTYEIPFVEVQNRQDIKQFFGEKYGANVRVVDINYSKELCGGTHAFHVGMLGYFRITKESSIAAGVRRIEATCGRAAEEFVREEEKLLHQGAAILNSQPSKLVEKISQLTDEIDALKQHVRSLKRIQIQQLALTLSQEVKNGFLAKIVEMDAEDLPELADAIMQKIQKGVIVLAIKAPNRVHVSIKVSPYFIEKGIDASQLIKKISSFIGGGGGGRPEMAQAGGKNPAGIEEAFNTIKTLLTGL